MIEKLFAVQNQRETFLLLCAGGVVLGCVMHLACAARRFGRAAALAGDLLAGLVLMALLAYAALRSGEGLRLYGLLGVTIGAAAYLAVVPRAFRGVFCIMKKLGSCFGCGRKSR